MEKEEQLFRKRIQELARTCFLKDVPVNTDFLNLSEQTIFQSISGTLPPVRYVLSGGSPVSERKVVCFLPSYEEELADPPYVCIRSAPTNRKFAEELSHRDFLGAVMNLGIERSMIGDIIIREGTAYMYVLKKISAYLAENLNMVRRTPVTSEVFPGLEEVPEPEFEEICGSVNSLRLDAVVALCGRLSRNRAVELVEGELVFINGQPVTQASRILKEGDVLSVRGLGKFLYSQAGGQTKKGRTFITMLKYK